MSDLQTTTPSYVDWEFAKATGARLVGAGPAVSPQEAADVVGEIRQAAAASAGPVAHTSALEVPGDAPAPLVVDRPTWISLNADSMAALMGPVFERIAARRDIPAPPAVTGVGRKVTGAEAGSMLAFMGSKVLGQYDLAPGGTPRLLLVAPNIVHAERELEVDPTDFRRWVCLHEETHRVQFTAVPWLREHVIARAQGLAVDLAPDPSTLPQRLQEVVTRLPEALTGDGAGLIDLLATAEQRAHLADLTAVMSLLEGHADVIMDDVGPEVVPTVAQIRQRFNARRKGVGAADRMLRRLLGLEAKMRQYRDGAVFVRHVIDEVGLDGFNAVWSGPDTLPLATEIADPGAWVRRVHG